MQFFVKWLRMALGGVALIALSASFARADLIIGVSAPLSGNLSMLGQQAQLGAQAAVNAANAAGGINGQNVRLVTADDGCTKEGASEAHSVLMQTRDGDDRFVGSLGYFCFEAAFAALDLAEDTDAPLLSLGVRLDEFEKRGLSNDGRRIGFRLAPSAKDEAKAIAKAIINSWRGLSFAIVDDGTVYGRSLAGDVRTELELAGRSPQLTDTYRPAQTSQSGLLRRLIRGGASAVFVAGDGEDIAVLARDAMRNGLPLQLMGGEAALAPFLPGSDLTVPDGLLAVGLARPENRDNTVLLRRQFDAANLRAEGYVLTAYAAVQTILAAATAAGPEGDVAKALDDGRFNTVLGLVDFDDAGNVGLDLMQLYQATDGVFVPLANQ